MSPRRLLWGLLTGVGGMLFFLLVGVKILYRLRAQLGKPLPCPAAWAWTLDLGPRRRTIPQVLDRVGIQPGERVLELGIGPGVYTVEAARRVGLEGRLIGVDIQPEMIAYADQRVQSAGLTNVETRVADAHDLPIEDGNLDRIFLVAVLAEIPDQDGLMLELRRVLRPGGTFSITEEFPDPDYLFAFEVIRRVERGGFTFEQRFGNFWQYTVNFTR
jgi:ubiquinone/menaquinone biosynthesis C-methylase UbiE